MNNTPKGNRKHIVFYGKRNAGKSSIMNAIIGHEVSLVSDVKDTTTDPVSKAVELIPFGPVVFIDTYGLDDDGQLGDLRVEKSLKTMERADYAIYVMSLDNIDENFYEGFIAELERKSIPYITAINKIDMVSKEKLQEIK